MLDSQIMTQMGTLAAQAETFASAQSAGISPSTVRKLGSWNGSTPFQGFAYSLTIYFKATGLAREHWGPTTAMFLEAEARQLFFLDSRSILLSRNSTTRRAALSGLLL